MSTSIHAALADPETRVLSINSDREDATIVSMPVLMGDKQNLSEIYGRPSTVGSLPSSPSATPADLSNLSTAADDTPPLREIPK